MSSADTFREAGVKFAAGHVSDVVGRICVANYTNGWTLGLECDFAAQLMAGVITSKLQGKDYKEELREALVIIAEGFGHAQAAAAALVSMFLWARFGR